MTTFWEISFSQKENIFYFIFFSLQKIQNLNFKSILNQILQKENYKWLFILPLWN